jgi:capsular polysaccharide biosynthesis protein
VNVLWARIVNVNKRLIAGAIAASLIACAIVTVLSAARPQTYEAEAKVYVDLRSTECSRSESVAGARICLIPLASATPLTRLAQSMVRIDAPSVEGEAIKGHRDLRHIPPGHLLNNLRVGRSEPFIELAYTDTDPKRAKEVVGTVGRIAAERINRKGGGAKAALKLPPDTRLRAGMFDRPKASLVGPNPVRNGLVALMATLAISGVIVAVREYLRSSRRTL